MRHRAPVSPYQQGVEAYFAEHSDGCPLGDPVQRSQWRQGYNFARNLWEDTDHTDARAPSVRSRVAGTRPSNYRDTPY